MVWNAWCVLCGLGFLGWGVVDGVCIVACSACGAWCCTLQCTQDLLYTWFAVHIVVVAVAM